MTIETMRYCLRPSLSFSHAFFGGRSALHLSDTPPDNLISIGYGSTEVHRLVPYAMHYDKCSRTQLCTKFHAKLVADMDHSPSRSSSRCMLDFQMNSALRPILKEPNIGSIHSIDDLFGSLPLA